MERQLMTRQSLAIGCVVIGLLTLSLAGCGESGGNQGETAGTSIRVVFPGQQAILLNEGPERGTVSTDDRRHTSLAGMLSHLTRFYEVSLAYAQVIPSSVATMQLTVTGPNMDPVQAPVDRDTGRATVPVPVGPKRVFTVQAFPAVSSTPNYIGQSDPTEISVSGASVTIMMQAATQLPPLVTNPGPQQHAEGDTVSLQIMAHDPNNNPLDFDVPDLPKGLSID